MTGTSRQVTVNDLVETLLDLLAWQAAQLHVAGEADTVAEIRNAWHAAIDAATTPDAAGQRLVTDLEQRMRRLP